MIVTGGVLRNEARCSNYVLMTHALTRRLRDPLYGLIRFDGEDPVDCLAWQLIDTVGFQRLRRIKQLGFSEFVFPGATHTRFAHSIGVFYTARNLINIIDRENPEEKDPYRAKVAVLAALLHDVGHGPFSHAFELAQKARGLKKNHEMWSAEIILSNESGIRQVLDSSKFGPDLAKDIAELLTTEVPQDIYHAVVSSSFDADRLDYLRRDKMMSGSGAGSIDFDWLLDNVRVANMDLSANDDAENGKLTPIFALGPKALQAAEAFLIARYHLYDQVYLHKTTRGFEIALRECLKAAADVIKVGKWIDLGLTDDHPLVVFLQEPDPSVELYLKLDDFVIWGCLGQFASTNKGKAGFFAGNILNREVMPCLDLVSVQSSYGLDPAFVHRKMKNIVKDELNKSVFIDQISVSCYGQIGADDVKLHKRITVDSGDEHYREITALSPVIESLAKTKNITRYYFLDKQKKKEAIDLIRNP